MTLALKVMIHFVLITRVIGLKFGQKSITNCGFQRISCRPTGNRLRVFSSALYSASPTKNIDNEVKALEKIRLLESEISRHNHLYYTLAKPEITDAQYDMLVREAKEILKKYPSLEDSAKSILTVGAPPSKSMGRVKHRAPMLSLDNALNEAELSDFLIKIIPTIETDTKISEINSPYFVLEPKIDGLSVSLIYEYGKLVMAATRGDGFEGEDVTANAKLISNIPTTIPSKLPCLEIRGEVYMSVSEWKAENAKRQAVGEDLLSNPRNAAVGALRRISNGIDTARLLRFFGYYISNSNSDGSTESSPTLNPNIIDNNDNILEANTNTHTNIESENIITIKFPPTQRSQEETLVLLQNLGFTVPTPHYFASTTNEILSICREFTTNRDSLDFIIDGVVIKVNKKDIQKSLGDGSRAPKWAIAYKFYPDGAETTLLDIIVQVGRTGALTPVAVLKPVNIGGVCVERASLHNQNEVRRLGLEIGCRVLVQRSADVIPKVVARIYDDTSDDSDADNNTTPLLFTLPSHCPSCGGPTAIESSDSSGTGGGDNSSDGVVVRCQTPGFLCPAQCVEKLRYFCSRGGADIASMGPAALQTLYQEGWIRTPVDIFTLPRRVRERELLQLQQQQLQQIDEVKVSKTKGKASKGKGQGKDKLADKTTNAINDSAFTTGDNAIISVSIHTSLPSDQVVIPPLLSDLPGWGEKSVNRLLEAIESRRSLPLDRFLTAMGIRHVGQETAKDLANHFGTLDALRADISSGGVITSSIPGVGPKAMGSLREIFGTNGSGNDNDNESNPSIVILEALLREIQVTPVPIKSSSPSPLPSLSLLATNDSTASKTSSATITSNKPKKARKKKEIINAGTGADAGDNELVGGGVNGDNKKKTSTKNNKKDAEIDVNAKVDVMVDVDESEERGGGSFLSEESQSFTVSTPSTPTLQSSTSLSPSTTPTSISTSTSTTSVQLQSPVVESSQLLPLLGRVVLLTGKLFTDELQPLTREQAGTICAKLGADVASTLNKSITLMIAGSAAGPSKTKKAASLGIEIWDEEQWKNLLAKHRELWK
eukprot:gene5775-11668_t